MSLKHLTDKQLLIDTKKVSAEDKKITLRLLHHIKEVDRRKLFSELKYPSLFKYVVEELGYSEGSAGRRISAARLLKDIPEIEVKIESGELNLTNLSRAADKFREERISDPIIKKEIITAIENTTTRECEQTLAALTSGQASPPPRYFTISLNEENYQLYEQIRGNLAHHHLNRDEMFKKILQTALERFTEIRFKKHSLKETIISSESRYIPAWMVNAVHERDKVCVKCGSSHKLEINHIIPFSMGGKTELSNLNLLCRNCNQRAAISSNLHFP